MTYMRPETTALANRLAEPRRFIQVVAGPRQVGKTTVVRQVLAGVGRQATYVSADEPGLRNAQWLHQQWNAARAAAGEGDRIIVVDEAQKIPGWSETVKRLWDEDTWAGRPLKVVLLGSAPLLIQQGLTESLAGRFEVLRIPHWSLSDMEAAFGWSVDQFVYYGGYPGAAPLIADPERWRAYVLDAIVEPTVGRDVLLLTRVDKPALLRQLFDLGCRYSGQIVSFTKMLGQLHDAGNTTTLAHYLDLLSGAGLVTGLGKYAGSAVRQRGSMPKLQVFNSALLAAASGLSFEGARSDPSVWGHFVESAVGAHLANAAMMRQWTVHYWRERNQEMDFVVTAGPRLLAIEVKSGRPRNVARGAAAFGRSARPDRTLLVGDGGIPLGEFLRRPVTDWLPTGPLDAVSEARTPWGRRVGAAPARRPKRR